MLGNLTKEIIYYSVIPVAILALIILVLLFVGKTKDDNYFKYSYFIKILLLIIIGLVLPLIIGYSAWVLERYINNNSLSSNILYIILLVILVISLIILLIVICTKLFKSFNKTNQIVE